MSQNNQGITDIPPVFMSIDELEKEIDKSPKEMWKGPWEKEETRQLLTDIFNSNRLGVSADPREGKNFELNVDLALRSSPGNVEVGILHKKGKEGSQQWEDVSEGRFANAAQLFLDSPQTLPTIHAPVDVNWAGLKQDRNKGLVLSEEERTSELNWLKREIPNKVRPFLNIVALKKEGISLWEDEEVNIDKNFKMPIVFHATDPTPLYPAPTDILRTSYDYWVDEKEGRVIFYGDIEDLAKQEGISWDPLENSYVPLNPEGKNIEDHLKFHKELVNKTKSLYKEVFNENTFTKEEIQNYLDRVNKVSTIQSKLTDRLDEKLKNDLISLSVQLSKLETTEKIVNDLYKQLEEFKEPSKDKILDEHYFIKKDIKDKMDKLERVLADSIELTKLESVGIMNEKLKDIYETYRKLDLLTTRHGTREEIEKEAKELSEKLADLYKDLETAEKINIPTQKKETAIYLVDKIKDFYERLEENEKSKEIEEKIKTIKDTNTLYNLVKGELENLKEKIKDSDKKLINVKSLEVAALEKASDSIAEFAKYLAKDPVFREHSFLAIENFFPESMFAGKVNINGKEEWAMKVLLEKTREKLKEKLKHEVGEKEAEKIANDMVGMTLDMGHFNLWRSRGTFKDKEEEKFQEMAADFVNSVKPFVKHIHLTDNPGTGDTHQEIGTGNVPNELAFSILKEEWDKQGIKPTITIEWGGAEGPAGTQPSNFENWRTATIPGYEYHRARAVSTLYQTFSYNPPSGIYYKSEPYLTSWLK